MEYYFKDKKFVIENYDNKSPFSSFLPGIAGKMGKPIWTFYVNRGQAMTSFGVRDKNSPILEFSPAVTSYQTVQTQGFRTFIKVDGKFFEPFCVDKSAEISRNMKIDEASLVLEEINKERNINTTVKYFGLPLESFPALVRKVEIQNTSKEVKHIEVLDGLTSILPSGLGNMLYKDLGNTMCSWMDVYNLDNDIAFYRMRASTEDSAEVKDIVEGHFFYSLVDGVISKPVVDKKLIFGEDTSMIKPLNFLANSLKEIKSSPQVTANKVPCGFTGLEISLNPNESTTIYSIYGHVADVSEINSRKDDLTFKYFSAKERDAYDIVRNITNDIATKTAYPIFDEYARQSYIDNFIRGGYPELLDNKKNGEVYYLYSRKHGDLERDYNWFVIEPEYFSQGNGNFRDANQNRRNDVLFKNYVKDYSIEMFMDLIQIDGYNPLNVNGVTFSVDKEKREALLNTIVDGDSKDLYYMLEKFTPGNLVNFLAFAGVKTKLSFEECLAETLNVSNRNFEASFGEGYWSDHWTYNFDLIENYLKIYPDKETELLLGENKYTYFQSPVKVLPRSEKYVLTKNNTVRQYGALDHNDTSKEKMLGVSKNDTNWLKDKNKKVYKTTLFEKLLSLATVKFSTLDQMGIGIEMEGGKPGWNDAANGIPGLFGSGVSETVELLRIVKYLNAYCAKHQSSVEVLEEIIDFTRAMHNLTKSNLTEFDYWDMACTIREEFRKKTNLYVSGKKVSISTDELSEVLIDYENKLNKAIEKALEIGKGILPTYLTYEATKYEVLKDSDGNNLISHYGLPKVVVKEFSLKPVAHFLEAPARSYKVLDKEEVALMHKEVKKTELYDKELGLYRTSEDLDPESMEIGRIRAFTKGWLERESCFLHMDYKYLLGLLKSKNYETYYEELKTNLVAFMDPSIYGRSTLENSSFLATSCNPDKSTHGKGYVSRLTGANTEFLSMWQTMMFGEKVFYVNKNGELNASFNPILTSDFFDENKEVKAKFLSSTNVTYVNVSGKDTWNCTVSEVYVDGIKLSGTVLNEKLAKELRLGRVQEVKVVLC